MSKTYYYAQVDFDDNSQKMRGWSNRKGYGTMTISKFDGSNVFKDIHPQNRLQPLTMPFGDHLPPKSDQLNPETNIAWNN